MTAPTSGPCSPWLTWDEVSAYCDPPNTAPALQDGILAGVTRRLWERSCRQFGVCSTTARPVWCCSQHRRPFCGCGLYPVVDLGDDPVIAVSSVKIDGATLAPSAYRVDEWRWLVRVDGDTWPACNDLSVATTESGTFEVTWTHGLQVPDDGLMAAALYVCKWATDLATGDCEVPVNATSVDREGVHIVIEPPAGSSGVAFVEAWLANFQCGHGGIFDPGARREIVRTGT